MTCCQLAVYGNGVCARFSQIITKFREIYSSAVLPIIMISARATEGSIVAALKNGADDYIVKPFKRAELIARIRAQVRCVLRPA